MKSINPPRRVFSCLLTHRSNMQQLTITPQFRPPAIIAHTKEPVAKIPAGTYQITGDCQSEDGASMVALMKDDVTYLVESTFLDWIKSKPVDC